MRKKSETDELTRTVEDVILKGVRRQRASLTDDEASTLHTDAFHILSHGFYWETENPRAEAAELMRVRDALHELAKAVEDLSEPAQSILRTEYASRFRREDSGFPFGMAKADGDPSGILQPVAKLSHAYSDPLQEAHNRLLRRDRILARPSKPGGGPRFNVQARFITIEAERIWKNWMHEEPTYGRDDNARPTCPSTPFCWLLKDLFEVLSLRVKWHSIAKERGATKTSKRD